MNEAPLSVWLISSKEGTIISAHCLGCKAGLGESCSHIASVLFYIEAWTRINEKLACTQVKCTWLLPTYVKEVAYAEVKDINFRSARRLKAELDKNIDEGKINVVDDSASSNTSKSLQCTPTDKEMDDLFLKLRWLHIVQPSRRLHSITAIPMVWLKIFYLKPVNLLSVNKVVSK